MSLIAGVFLLNHALPRMKTAGLREVPIERLPAVIGDWKRVEDIPIESFVHLAAPNARFLSREYQNKRGQRAQLLLETSTDAQMYHSPLQCLPAHDWNILRTASTQIRPRDSSRAVSPGEVETAATMQIQSGNVRASMLYWYTTESQLDKWERLKTHLLAGRQPSRLFVRILVVSSSGFETSSADAQKFAEDVLPAVTSLETTAYSGGK